MKDANVLSEVPHCSFVQFFVFVLMAPEATTIKSIYVGGGVGHLIVGTTNL